MSYAYVATGGREHPEAEGPRVLRGGSWISGRIGCRCAYRDLDHPGGRANVVGFRVCFAPPIK
jgi:formylglycine-generating enzyme required for sulfatase activity